MRLFKQLMQFSTDRCHHIISIFGDQESPPIEKGNLYLGGVGSFKEPIINNFRITCALSIIDSYMYKKQLIENKCKYFKLKHKWIDLEDEEDCSIYPFLDEAHQYIKTMLKEHNVLVHCQVGMSRSASLVIAYLMKEYKMSFKDAMAHTKKKRKIIQPNEGFEKDLMKFEEYLKEHNHENNKQDQ